MSEILHSIFHQWLVSEVLHLKLYIRWYVKFYTRICLLIGVRNSTLNFSSVVGVRSSTLLAVGVRKLLVTATLKTVHQLLSEKLSIPRFINSKYSRASSYHILKSNNLTTGFLFISSELSPPVSPSPTTLYPQIYDRKYPLGMNHAPSDIIV